MECFIYDPACCSNQGNDTRISDPLLIARSFPQEKIGNRSTHKVAHIAFYFLTNVCANFLNDKWDSASNDRKIIGQSLMVLLQNHQNSL